MLSVHHAPSPHGVVGLGPLTSRADRASGPEARGQLSEAIAAAAKLFSELTYDELLLSYVPEERTLWCWMRPDGPPSFTPGMLKDLIDLRRRVQSLVRTAGPGANPVEYFVGGSTLPGIYNLGGDLAVFASLIRAGDRDALRRYAYDCVDVSYHMASSFEAQVTTVALVQGDALGGGFEGALSFNVLVAEKSAKFGLPEVLFNLFPGMGAYTFLSRRLDPVRAERMILSGKIMTGEELYEIGLVDRLAEDGRGQEAVREYIGEARKRWNTQRAIFDVRRRVAGPSHEELREVTDIWVDAALRLEDSDLRKMERLMKAQRRRLER